MPTRRFRSRNSTKVAEERCDALPWSVPNDSVSIIPQFSLPSWGFFPTVNNLMRYPNFSNDDPYQGMANSSQEPGPFGTPMTGPPPAYAQNFGIQNEFSENSRLGKAAAEAHLLSPVALTTSRRLGLPPVGVFWDIENCQVPRGRSALIAVQRIRETFYSRFLEAEFLCVCDIRKESPLVIQELNDAQISVVHVSGTSKNAADDKLRQAMRRFADVYTSIMPLDSPPAAVILISGDINFASDLSDLKYRKRLYIILLHNKHAPEALLLCSDEHYDFHSLLGDLPARAVAREDFDEEKEIPLKGGHCPMDVVVSELPLVRNVNKIKTRLKKLSDNCGGKVVSIQGHFAIIRFPNKEAALRATKRMNGEDVFGSKIRVLYSSQIEIPPPQVQQNQQQQQVQMSQQMVQAHQSGMGVPVAGTAVIPAMSPPPETQYPNNPSRKKSTWKRSATSIEQNTNGDYLTLKKEVAALLQDVPNHCLPLFKFREMFERRYRRSVSSYDLYRMRDVVNISESSSYSSSSSASTSSSSGRNISLCQEWVHKQDDLALFCKLHPPKVEGLDKCRTGWAEKEVTPAMPVVTIDLKALSTRVHAMLQSHNGSLPILSFLDCYEFSFGPIELAEENHGVPLEHLITCVQGVEIGFSETGMKQVQWTEKELDLSHLGMSQAQALQMAQLSRELIDLFKTFPRCCLPFSKLIPAYHHHFGRQCRVADYGHTTLSSLLKTLPGTIQVMGENQNRILTLAHKAQMKRFATDVLRVLKAQGGPRKEVRVEDFPMAFSQVFPGRIFNPEDYGLCFLSDLLQELVENSSLVAMHKDDEGHSLLAIPKREQTPQEIHKTRIFATEVFDLLRHSIRCEIPFSKFIPAYHHHFGRQCRVADYGFSKLAELFEAITDTVTAVSPNSSGVSSPDCSMDDKILRLTPKEQLKVVGEQIWGLVEKRGKEGLATSIDDLDELYLKEYGFLLRPDLCEAESIRDLIEKKLSQFIKVEGDRLVLVDRTELEQLAQDAKSILENEPDCTMALDEFIHLFQSRFHQVMDLAVIQRDLAHLMLITEDENGQYFITLAPLKVFARDIVDLLEDVGGYMAISSFDAAYLQKFGRPVNPSVMGFPSLAALLQAIPDVVTIRGASRQKRLIVLNNCPAILSEKRQGRSRPHSAGSVVNHQRPGSANNNGAGGKTNNGLDGARWSPPKWRPVAGGGHGSPSIPSQVFPPGQQSPMFLQRPSSDTVFSFDRPAQLSPPVYDMWMRDTTTPASPPMSPPMVWAYHPVVYPAPPTSPVPSNIMVSRSHTEPVQESPALSDYFVQLPSHFSFGSGPWSPPPPQMMMYEQRLPAHSVNIPTSGVPAGSNPGVHARLTNSFQRLKVSNE